MWCAFVCHILRVPAEMRWKHWAATVDRRSFDSLNIRPVCFCVSRRNAAVICFIIGCNNVHKTHTDTNTHTFPTHLPVSGVFAKSTETQSASPCAWPRFCVCADRWFVSVCAECLGSADPGWYPADRKPISPLSRRAFLCCGDGGRKVNKVVGGRSMQMLHRGGGTLVTTNQLWLHTGPAYETFICWCLASLSSDTGGD